MHNGSASMPDSAVLLGFDISDCKLVLQLFIYVTAFIGVRTFPYLPLLVIPVICFMEELSLSKLIFFQLKKKKQHYKSNHCFIPVHNYSRHSIGTQRPLLSGKHGT